MAEIPFLEQAKTFWSKLALWQKALFAGIPAVMLIGIILLFVSTGEKQVGVLYSGLEQQDAGKITESLKAKQIDYELAENGTAIIVDKEILYDTRLTLANEGLPEQSVVGYELFDKTNLGMSEFVQKLNYRRALEGELARTIGEIDEVHKVRVHIVIPDKALFKKDQKNPTGSVTLHLKNGRSLDKISIDGIQNLVASSIEGMSPKDVTVVDQRGNMLNEQSLDMNSVAGLTAQQHEQQRRVEDHLAGKVQSMLDAVLGADNTKVRINADLDFTRIEQTKTDYDPERQVIRSEQNIKDVSQSTDSLSYPAVSMAKDQSNVIQNYEIAQNVEHIIHSVGNIERLSVAVMINGTNQIVDSNGTKQMVYVPRPDEEMQKITEIVRNAVGFDPSRNDQISVINVPFDTMINYNDIEQFNIKPWYERPDIQKLIALVITMLIALFIMWKLLQNKQVKDRMRLAMYLPQKVSVEDEPEEEEEEEEEEVEDLDFDDEEMLLLPAELPEQLLLEGEKLEEQLDENSILDDETGLSLDQDALAKRARAELEESQVPELTEDAMMKIEIRHKVEDFCDVQTDEAVRLIRMMLSQDLDIKNYAG